MAFKGPRVQSSYLLGLLAKIKCSICSYQCENWYIVIDDAIFTSIFSTSLLFSFTRRKHRWPRSSTTAG